MKIILKRIAVVICISIVSIIVLSILFILIGRKIHKSQYKVKSTNGIQEIVTIKVNNIEQQLSIRGDNRDNPIILFLHGGPGNPMGYLDYVWQPYLSDNFTIVTFAQRGSGQTYYRNPTAEVSKDLIIADIDKTVDYLRERFGQDKIIVMGHSWGTLLGTLYVHSYPEKVSSYIGVAQIVKLDNRETKPNISSKSLKGNREKKAYQMYLEALLSPNISFKDLKWFLIDYSKVTINQPLKDEMNSFDANNILEYQIPMYFISGSNDYGAPVEAVKSYYDKLRAPEKNISIIDGTGHATFIDQPEDFAQAVKQLQGGVLTHAVNKNNIE